jgi:hypothetical protein
VPLRMAPVERWRAHQRDARRIRGRERPEGVSMDVRRVLEGWIESARSTRTQTVRLERLSDAFIEQKGAPVPSW